MSQNVLKKQRPLRKPLRMQKLIAGLRQGLTLAAIAEECQCSEKTIDRDFAEWRESGGFDKWLYAEFMRLHSLEISKEDGGQAYRCVADLLKKCLVDRKEIHTEGNLHFNLDKELDALIEFSRCEQEQSVDES